MNMDSSYIFERHPMGSCVFKRWDCAALVHESRLALDFVRLQDEHAKHLQSTCQASNLLEIASNLDGLQPSSDGLQPTSEASNLLAMASNLLAKASNLRASASNHLAMASNLHLQTGLVEAFWTERAMGLYALLILAGMTSTGRALFTA